MRRIGSAVAVMFAFGGAAFAAPVYIPNASFEAGTGYGGVWGGEPADWNRTQTLGVPAASTVLQVMTDTTYSGKDGSNYLQMNVDGGPDVTESVSTNTIYSSSLGTYAPGTGYTLTVAAATNANYTPNRSLTIALLADGGVVASSTRLFTELSATAFQDISVVLDTQSLPSVVGKELAISITHTLHNEQYGKQVSVDNVRLDATAVPEPTSLAMVAVTGLIGLRRRRR